jgi:hypothetical protein
MSDLVWHGVSDVRQEKETRVDGKSVWAETAVSVDTVDWKGRPIKVSDVPALLNTKTGKTRVYPSEVAKAELRDVAKRFGLEPRDLAILLMLEAQPGSFLNKEDVQFRYHLNKMLFYQWKGMEREGLGETYPHDEFVKADRGPVPAHIVGDLERLSSLGFITNKKHRWGARPKDESIQISLTKKGSEVAGELWNHVPEPLLDQTTKAKSWIYPLTPESVRIKVHKEFPEYKNTYIEEDTD